MLPLLMLITELLLPGEEFKGPNMSILVIQFVCCSPSIPKPYHISIHAIIFQPLQGPVKGAVHHVGLG
jgi:hypothetical protein